MKVFLTLLVLQCVIQFQPSIVSCEILVLSRVRPIVKYYFLEEAKAKRRHEKEIETNSIISSDENDEDINFSSSDSESDDESNEDARPINGTGNKTVSDPTKAFKPIVLWHGMGDNAVGVKFALNFLTQEMPGIYIKSLQIGPNPAKDIENGFFLNVNEQVAMVCEMLSQDKLLENGYNAIGLSQGGQFLRAVAQRCPNPPMLNLISLGGQHQGVFGIPRCSAPKQEWCEIIDKLLTHAAYSEWVQKFLVQAEYWHDPFKPQIYAENSVFLADINNERVVNKTYKDNLQKLRNLVLVMFEGDTIVQPKDSEWFGYFVDGQDKIMYKMEDSLLYKEDRIGLKALNESGRLHLLSVPGNHLIFSKAWFIRNIVKPFLM